MRNTVKHSSFWIILTVILTQFYFVESALSQKKSGLVFSIEEIGSFNFQKHNANSETVAQVGYQWNKELSSFRLSFAYHFTGNMWNKPSFSLQNHLIGASIEYHILNNKSRFRPILGFTVLTGVGTNYKDKVLHPINYYPITFNTSLKSHLNG